MRLGIVYHMPCWRGADGTICEIEGSFARYVDSLAPYFDEIVLCVPVSGAPLGPGTAVKAGNVRLAPLPMFDGPVHFYPRLPVMLSRIGRFVRSIDVLHCRVPTPAALFAFVFARIFGRPSFVLVVGDLAALRLTMPYRGLKKMLWWLYTLMEERSIQRMVHGSLTFANGQALAVKHSRRGHEVLQTQTSTISLADIGTRQDTCAAAPLRLLTVSRIDPRKGLRVLPDVLAWLTNHGVQAELDIVGAPVGQPGEMEQQAIESRVREMQVQARFTGPIPLDRLLHVYQQYDVFVLPTLPGEGVPRVLLEAMAAGTPVVTTRVAGIPSLITHERNGMLVNSPDAAAIGAAIARVVTDGVLRRQLIASGYETAKQYTLEAQAMRMMQGVSERLGMPLRQPAVVRSA